MIPAAFAYQRPTSLDEAVRLLGPDGGAKVLAGGQTLLPLLKLRLGAADTLVDIGRIDELKGQGPTPDGGYRMGSLTTYAEVLASTQLPFARECLEGIADVQVRNRGTVGGAIAHADPASDAPALALALDYSVTVRSARGERNLPLDGFFKGPFETALASDEILVSLQRGPLPDGIAGSYQRLENPASGYSFVGVCAVVARSGGAISHARVAITGVGDHAYRAKAVEAGLLGSDGSAASVEAAAAHATDGIDVVGDIHADKAYRTAMAAVYTRRAIEAALDRLG